MKADERDQFRKSLHKKVIKKSDLRPNMKLSIDEINTAVDDEKVFGSFDDEEEFIINEKIMLTNGRNVMKYPDVNGENQGDGSSRRISNDLKNKMKESSLPIGKSYNLPGTNIETVHSIESRCSVIADQDPSLTSDTPRSEDKIKNGENNIDNKNITIISKLNRKPVEEVVIKPIDLNLCGPGDRDKFIGGLDDKNKLSMVGKKKNDEKLHNEVSECKDKKYANQPDPVLQRKSSFLSQQSLMKTRVTGSTGSLNKNTGSLNKSLGLLSNSTASLTDKRPFKKCTGVLNKSADSLINKELNLPVKSKLKKKPSPLNNSTGSLSKKEPGFSSSSLPSLDKSASLSDGIGSSVVGNRVFPPKLSLQKNADSDISSTGLLEGKKELSILQPVNKIADLLNENMPITEGLNKNSGKNKNILGNSYQLNNKIISSSAETSKDLKSTSYEQQKEKQSNNDNQFLTGNQNEKDKTNPWNREGKTSSNELLTNESVDKNTHQGEGYYWKEVVDSEGEMFATPPQERKQVMKIKNKKSLQKNLAQIENDPDVEIQTNEHSEQDLREVKKLNQQTFQENYAHKNSQETGSKIPQEEKIKNIPILNLSSDGKFPIENKKESKSNKSGNNVVVNPEDTIGNSEKKLIKNEERKNNKEKKSVPTKSFSDELNKEFNDVGFFGKFFSKPKHEEESKLNTSGESQSIKHEGKTLFQCNEKHNSTIPVLKTQTYQDDSKKATINENIEPAITMKTSIKKEEKYSAEENCEDIRIKTKSVFFEIKDGMNAGEKQKNLNNRMSNKLINPKDNPSKINHEIAEKSRKHRENKEGTVEKILSNDLDEIESLDRCPKENKQNQEPIECKNSPKKISKGSSNKTESSPFKVNKLKQDNLIKISPMLEKNLSCKNKTFKQEMSKNLPVLDNQSINVENSQEHKLKKEFKQLTPSPKKALEKVHSLSPIKMKLINTKVSIQNEKQTVEDVKSSQLRKIEPSYDEPPSWESIRRPIYQAYFSNEDCFIPNSELEKESAKTRSQSEAGNNSPDGVRKKNTEKKQPKTQIAFGRTVKVDDQRNKPNPIDIFKTKKSKFTQQQRLSTSCGLIRKSLSESARKDNERIGIFDDKNEHKTSLSELKYPKAINSPSKTTIYSKNKSTTAPESLEKKDNFFRNQTILEKSCPSNFCSSSMLDMQLIPRSRTKNKAERDNLSQPNKVNSLQHHVLSCSYDPERKVDKFSRDANKKEEEPEKVQNEVLANSRVNISNVNARPVAYRLVRVSSGNIAANKRPDARVVTNKVRSCAKGGNKKEDEYNRNLSGKKKKPRIALLVTKIKLAKNSKLLALREIQGLLQIISSMIDN